MNEANLITTLVTILVTYTFAACENLKVEYIQIWFMNKNTENLMQTQIYINDKQQY